MLVGHSSCGCSVRESDHTGSEGGVTLGPGVGLGNLPPAPPSNPCGWGLHQLLASGTSWWSGGPPQADSNLPLPHHHRPAPCGGRSWACWTHGNGLCLPGPCWPHTLTSSLSPPIARQPRARAGRGRVGFPYGPSGSSAPLALGTCEERCPLRCEHTGTSVRSTPAGSRKCGER